MLEALTASGFLGGLVRQMGDQYDALPRDEIETCIGEAVNGFFAAASSGRRVANPGGWLWKATWNKARDLWLEHYSGRAELAEADDPSSEHKNPRERAAADARADRLRDEALRQARALVPLIGTGQVVDVLRLLLDAVAEGLPDLPAKDIADTLGIGEDTARALVSRALKRLERAARQAGIALPDDLARDEPDAADATASPWLR
jgi:DNA-directed RNA polymerase specialized sigma24 family protein